MRAWPAVAELEARMWVFSEWADGFDKVKTDNNKALDGWLQDWVATTLNDDSPWYRNAAVYAGAGLAYSVNKLSTEVLGGFVDVLRIGDGVRDGGWGYGKDALRLLVLVGPALRAVRFAGALVSVDVAGGRCAWVAGSQALRMTGTRHFARVGDLAKAVGLTLEDTGGASFKAILPALQRLGANARLTGTLYSVEDVAELAQRNPNSVIMFGVRWTNASGRSIGHAMLLTRGPGGVIRIIDRSGRVVSSLAELETAYPGISSAVVLDQGVLVQNSLTVDLLNNAPILMNLLALELRSVPVPPPLLDQQAPIVLKTNPQLLAGWWWVYVGQWVWAYVFTPNGTVTWTDPYNHRSGKGRWKDVNGSIQIVWDSGSKESWPITANYVSGTMTGTYTFKGKESDPLDVKALKVPPENIQQLVGKWRVNVDKYVWDYDFDPYGHVRWTDPFNKETGTGTWSLAKDTIYISWAPASGSREEWDLPLQMDELRISYRASWGTFKYPQAKASKLA